MSLLPIISLASAALLPPSAHPDNMQHLSAFKKQLQTAICFLGSCLWFSALASIAGAEDVSFSPEQLEFFENKIRPLLVEHCYECHSGTAKRLEGGLKLDSRAAVIAGGDSGASFTPGQPDDSLLLSALRYEEFEMPPKGKLPTEQIELFEQWIELGAPWPISDQANAADAVRPAFDLQARKASHWVWTAPVPVTVPDCKTEAMRLHAVDRLVAGPQELAGIVCAPVAPRDVLLRRLFFDLIGLPPTFDEQAKFTALSDELWFDQAVDYLLASPHFGERWGRHWLDLVRYAESRGHEFDADAPNAFQYRDYVIRAINEDVPYPQFIREQIAGDLLDSPRLNSQKGFNESILGTGFWFMGEWVHSPVDTRKDESDRFDNMIDVMSKAFLGVTVACARCHDHKFDAISTKDYYAMSGFLQSSDYRQVPFESLEHNREIAARLANLDQQYDAKLKSLYEQSVVAEQPSSDERFVSTQESKPENDAIRHLVDWTQLDPKDWSQDGFAFGNRPLKAGDWRLVQTKQGVSAFPLACNAAVFDSAWAHLSNETEPATRGAGQLPFQHRSGRTLHTPTVSLVTGNVWCQVVGQGQIVAVVDSHRQVDGPLHGQTIARFDAPRDTPETFEGRWIRMDLKRYVGHRVHFEFTPQDERTFAVLGIVEMEQGDPSKHFGKPILYGEPASDPQSAELVKQWQQARQLLESQIVNRSALAMAMIDVADEDDTVLIRGNSANVGPVVPRRFLEAIDGSTPLAHRSRSGRLEMAERLCEPSNPLVARVYVNRIWHHLLGRGIVPTTDDFGVLGMRPSNQPLLDHLAIWFQQHDWSLKQTIRYIVSSRTYQLSGNAVPASLAADPTNQVMHYRPPRRLEGESIRDSILELSGSGNHCFYGVPIPVHLTNFMDGRGRPGTSGPEDGAGRRSIYLAVRRNFLSPFMLAFDSPIPFSSMGRRNVSNVPAQALILMNDPFIKHQCDLSATRFLKIAETDSERIDRLIQTCFARSGSAVEREAMLAYLNERRAVVGETAAWSELVHAMVNTKEFIFIP